VNGLPVAEPELRFANTMGGETMTSNNSIVVFDELTAGDRFRVFWGFIWRGVLLTIASAVGGVIVGAMVGFVLGLIAHFLGWPANLLKTAAGILGGIAGGAVGLWMAWQYIRWLFRAKWSGYQLRLVRQDA
jgi:ABC-type amino acid transport system permease subunit